MPARWIAALLIAATACGKSAMERRYANAVIPMMERYVIIAELLARRG